MNLFKTKIKKSEECQNKGLVFLQRGNIETAIQELVFAIEYNPKNSRAHSILGDAYTLQGKPEIGIVEYSKAIIIDPNQPVFFRRRGYNKFKVGDCVGAFSDLDEAIRLNPHDAKAFDLRAFVKLHYGDVESAILDYQEAIKLSPRESSFYNDLGLAYMEQNNWEGAIKSYNLFLKLLAQDEDVLFMRGCANYNFGDFRSAIRDFNKVIKINPEYSEAKENKAQAQLMLKTEKLERINLQKEVRSDHHEHSRPHQTQYETRGSELEAVNKETRIDKLLKNKFL